MALIFFFYYFYFVISAIVIFIELQVDRDWVPSKQERFQLPSLVKERSHQMINRSFGKKFVARVSLFVIILGRLAVSFISIRIISV